MRREQSRVLVGYAFLACIEPIYVALYLVEVKANPNQFEGVSFNQFVIVG